MIFERFKQGIGQMGQPVMAPKQPGRNPMARGLPPQMPPHAMPQLAMPGGGQRQQSRQMPPRQMPQRGAGPSQMGMDRNGGRTGASFLQGPQDNFGASPFPEVGSDPRRTPDYSSLARFLR